jgi:hypothetical protein
MQPNVDKRLDLAAAELSRLLPMDISGLEIIFCARDLLIQVDLVQKEMDTKKRSLLLN